jgi:hypothetical protein
MDLEKEIELLKERNKRVEADKAWETSGFRKLIIAVLTYLTIALLFLVARLPNPLAGAIVPSAAFFLSTLSLPYFKKLWVQYIRDENTRD